MLAVIAGSLLTAMRRDASHAPVQPSAPNSARVSCAAGSA